MKRILTMLLIASLFLFATAGIAGSGVYGVGDDVSGFSSHYLDGSAATGLIFSEHTVSVVTYFATWSGSSLYNLQLLDRLSGEYAGMGVFGLLHEDGTSTVAAALQYMNDNGHAFPVFTSDDVWASLTGEAAVIPQSFFIDENGTVLEVWHGAFSSYTQLAQRAEYWLDRFAATYTVTFMDGLTGQVILSVDNVREGESVSPPAPPTHEGYVFSGWSSDEYTYVTDNIVITANYSIRSYQVRFFCSIDNALISSQYVTYGGVATAPIPHTHEGHTFIGWSRGLDNITSETDIYAVYRSNQSDADGDLDGNGVVTTADALLALRICMGVMEPTPYQLVHGDMDQSGQIESADALLILRIAMLGGTHLNGR